MAPPPLAVLAYAFHEFAYVVGELTKKTGVFAAPKAPQVNIGQKMGENG